MSLEWKEKVIAFYECEEVSGTSHSRRSLLVDQVTGRTLTNYILVLVLNVIKF